MRSKIAMTVAAIGASLFLITAPAQAQHWRGGGWHGGGWHGGWHGRGIGVGAGFAAGALVGGALAGGYYYGPYGYGYGGGYGPGYASGYGPYDGGYGPDYAYDDTYDTYGYDSGPGVAVGARYASGADASYCSQRYRSYNPATGTYLGYDGQRHPCP